MNLAIFNGKPEVHKRFRKFRHPKISSALIKAVSKQINESISIYNNGGIYKRLESKLRKILKTKYVLTVNSGTNALFSMYFSLNLQEGDEVIVPVYTFFATATPLFLLGVIPILTDCEENGNISPREIRKNITKKTKAIVMTHMWGIPCKIEEIIKIGKEKRIKVLEDASHAFEAIYNGRYVGTQTDGAV